MFGRVSSLSDCQALSHKVGGMIKSKLVTAYLKTISKIMTYTRSKFWANLRMKVAYNNSVLPMSPTFTLRWGLVGWENFLVITIQVVLYIKSITFNV